LVRAKVPFAVVRSVGRAASLADSLEHVPRNSVSLYAALGTRPVRLTEIVPVPDVVMAAVADPLMPRDPTFASHWAPTVAALAGPTATTALKRTATMAVMTARPVNVMAGFPRDPGAIRRTCGGEPTLSASRVRGELCSAGMGELKPEQVIALVAPIAVIQLGLMIAALVDLERGERRVRGGNKIVWALVIIVVNVIGPILYFVAGREEA
jgi:hypothetical protein